MSIQRTDRGALEQAIDAYRGESAVPPPPDQSRLERRTAHPVRLVRYQPPGPALPAPQPAESPESPNAIRLSDLGLDVEVDTLPDLDIIIVTGRDKDVEQLAEIIRQLDRLSAETQPQVSVYYLKHGNGESIEEIVTQVSEVLVGGRQGRVSVTALVKPNALLLVGWGEAVNAMRQLIRKLDRPVSPQSQFAVFRLKHAPAAKAPAC